MDFSFYSFKGWCAAKTIPALVSEHINLMAGTLFSWAENSLSSLGPLKIECCWDNTLSESPPVWFPAGSSPPVSLAAWVTPVRACVDAMCWRKGLQLLSVPVFMPELSSEMCSNGLSRFYSSCSPWWDTTCLWTLCTFTRSSTGHSQVLPCVAAVLGCCPCTGGGTGGAVAICHHRHLQGLASSRAGCFFWALNSGEGINACSHFSFLLFCDTIGFLPVFWCLSPRVLCFQKAMRSLKETFTTCFLSS